jgi:hypothetical protein
VCHECLYKGSPEAKLKVICHLLINVHNEPQQMQKDRYPRSLISGCCYLFRSRNIQNNLDNSTRQSLNLDHLLN